MKIALAQLNPIVGAMAENAQAVRVAAERAADAGAELLVTTELALPGYPPLDLLERTRFLERCREVEAELVDALPPGLIAIFGNVHVDARGVGNAAVVARRGEVIARCKKLLLPTYDVFDEARYFARETDPTRNVIDILGTKVAVTVCEDLWNDAEFWPTRRYDLDPVEAQVAAGATLIVNLSSSPFRAEKIALRRDMIAHSARRHKRWVIHVNQAGGNDGLLFDGRSMAFAPDGTMVAKGRAFATDLCLVDTSATPVAVEFEDRDPIADIHDALVLGIRDYFGKLGFKKAAVALSGGIDSAVTAHLAAEALGAENVTGIGLPSRYSSSGSVDDARELAEKIGMPFHLIEIEPMFSAYLAQLAPVFEGRPPGLAEENLQARIRGALIMAYANKMGAVVLTTGNKSESAVGYCTLYGDTCGGLAPLADCYKHQVYALARYANRERSRIPISTIDKPPSAELRPDQKDEDSLPPYDLLDEILRLFIEEAASPAAVAEALDQPLELTQEIARKLYAAEFKRKQFPPTLRVSKKAWVGRVYPLAHRFRE